MLIAWRHFWFGPVNGLALGIFRIVLGLLSFCVLASLHPDWSVYFSETEWVLCIGLLSSIFLSFGLFSRSSALVTWAIVCHLAMANRLIVTAADEMLRTFLFMGIFLPLGSEFSLDKKLFSPASEQGSAWPIRLLQINLACIYFGGAIGKLMTGSDWVSGGALEVILRNQEWSRVAGSSLFNLPIILQGFNYGVVAFELVFPFLLWQRRHRTAIVTLGLCFHLLIMIFMKNLIFFSCLMGLGLTLFLPAFPLATSMCLRSKS